MTVFDVKHNASSPRTAFGPEVMTLENVTRPGSHSPVQAGTRLMGLLGADIRHADLAFAFNNKLLSLWGSEFVYLPYPVPGDRLEDAADGIRALDILSCNVTFPYKVSILKHVDRVDEAVWLMGSVNLVVNRSGELWGYNTDSDGFMHALQQTGFMPQLDSALIYGCGGAGRALVVALSAAGIRTIWLYDLIEEKCEALEMVHNHNGHNGHRILATSRHHLPGLRPALIVNATPAGRGQQADISPLQDLKIAESARLFFDLNYNPPRSKFLQQADSLGIAAENGLRMMCYQAKRSIEVTVGRVIPWDWYTAAIRSAGLENFMVSATAPAGNAQGAKNRLWHFVGKAGQP
jgi:shikimate dehydrogenase